MPRPKGSGRVPGSGRKKGTLNRATLDLKAAIQKHGPELVQGLLELTRSADEKVRIHAIRECLDRAYGRPSQTLTTEPDEPLEIRVTIIHPTVATAE